MKGLNGHVLDVAIPVVLIFMPFWMGAIGGYTELATRIVVMGLAAMSLNFLLGFTGVLSFGHAAYFGLGAYGAAMAIKYLGAGTIPAMGLGMLIATFAAMVIGALIVKRRGVYFAMVTIAFGQVFYFLAFRWNAVTGGDDGLTGWHRLPIDFGFMRLDIFGSDKAFYYFALAVFAICVAAMAMLLASPFGRTLIAIRENERRARFLGVPIEFHIWLSFVISVPVRQRRGRALCAAQQLYRPARAALRPVGQSGDHGGARRHALVLGAAGRSGNLRRASGLRLQPHAKLDVGHRARLRAGRAFLPSRSSGHAWLRSEGVTLLQVQGASKRFGNLVALGDVSLTIEPGELRAIIGPNGAGKTTFFNLVSGLFAPTTGAILFDGRDVTGLAPDQRVARGMARTFQITEIFPELSVADNLRVAVEIAAGYRLRAWLGRAARKGVEKRIVELLEMGSLADKKDVRVGALSHGDQRTTEIMMSLALRPLLLMLDEPTAGMGDQETYDIAKLVRRLHRQAGLTIMLIEHDMRVVFNLADRIMVLAEGRVLAEGTPQEIAVSDKVQAAYLGKAAA